MYDDAKSTYNTLDDDDTLVCSLDNAYWPYMLPNGIAKGTVVIAKA